MKILKLKSPAKLNLYLCIINKRPDGYHNIVTLFERIDLCDEVTIDRGEPMCSPLMRGQTHRSAPTIHITCSDPSIPTGPENLAYKAAQALLDYAGKRLSCHITIKKRIPVAAGLGGGSSNAAAVLIGLNRLWRLGLSKKELMKIGAKIGADVNFFLLDSSFAVGTGKGEKLRPVRISRPMWHVLVAPAKGFSTKEIYQLYDRHCEPNVQYTGSRLREVRRSQPVQRNRGLAGNLFAMTKGYGKFALTQALADVKMLLRSIRSNNLALFAENLHNDLEAPAKAKDDTIFKIKTIVTSCKAKGALMSGSGSSVFGIVPSMKEATRIKRKLTRLKRGWQVFAARTY